MTANATQKQIITSNTLLAIIASLVMGMIAILGYIYNDYTTRSEKMELEQSKTIKELQMLEIRNEKELAELKMRFEFHINYLNK